jgi:hypothetical protein
MMAGPLTGRDFRNRGIRYLQNYHSGVEMNIVQINKSQ